ncbi:MAG TPA: histidine kinase [Streptosporangiaceae bacterium]|nr:histidine kinase [Streptosporangiaceae bacterium]
MPGLYAWLRRNPRLGDGALALLLVFPGGSIPKLGILRTLAILPFVLGMAVPVVFRRAYPVEAFAVVIAVGALQVLLLRRPAGADLAVLVVLYTLAASRPRRVSLRGLAVCLAGAAAAIVCWHPARGGLDLYTLGTEAALFGAPVLLAWLLGDSARWRRGYYQALEERAARLERERDAQAQVAAAAERARIAREIHDVVAHNVSVMVVQADGAAFALDGSPQRAREALAAISATGRRALAEMRSLLGVLREPADSAGPAPGGAGPALAPQPGVEDLADLLEQARAAGLPVSLTIGGDPRPVPAGEALAVYRVVQESLTNVRKHAGPDATAVVSLDYDEGGLLIRVTDDGAGASAVPGRLGGVPGPAGPTGPGHGLAGMRERVELYGGTARSGPRPGGGYEVVARLPVAMEAV